METIRAFIAIELPPDIQTGLNRVLKQLAPATKAVRWVPAANIHLTLKFLGDTPVDKVEQLKNAIKIEALQHEPFEIQAGTLGAFPSPRRPRVVWIGVQAPNELSELAEGIETATIPLGFPSEGRPFSPHLTLGRVSQHAAQDEINKLADLLLKTQVGSLGTAKVTGVHFFRSDLRPGGAVYTSLFQADFKNL